MTTEQLLVWVAVGLYGLSAFCFIIGFIGKGERLFLAGTGAAGLGWLAQLAQIVTRWTVQGVNPFVTISESISLGMAVTVLLFLFGIPLCLVVVGAPMILAAWIWALITGIDIMNQSKAARQLRQG